jgi:hypothetical protein
MAIIALVGTGLIALSSTLPADSAGSRIAFALGTGLLAAAMFTSAQTVIAASAANRVLIEALGEQNQIIMRALTDEYRSLNSTYLPTHVFEGSPRPDPTFNRQLTRDLAASQIYLFRGVSGRHTAARLLAASSGHWEVRVITADLRARESLHERARYLLRAGRPETLDEIYADIAHQVRYGLVGLYRARLRCSRISITVSRSPSLDRFEIFDESVWVTLYSDVSSPAAEYPRSLRFHRDSFVYAMQRRDFQRSMDDADTEVIEPSMTDDGFADLYRRLTGESITAPELAKLHTDFDRFRTGFVAEARLE